jgi:quercetin dioxygenase-like cupin family protein
MAQPSAQPKSTNTAQPPKVGLIRNIADAPSKTVEMPGVEGVKMAVMCGREHGAPNFAIRSFTVDPNGHAPHHSHDYEHEVYIVDGGGSVLLDGEYRPIRAGDIVYIPADHEHQLRAGPQGMKFLCMVPVNRNCGDPTPGS